jgi:hypothetical protein
MSQFTLSPDTNSKRHVVLDDLTAAYLKGRLTDTHLRSLWAIAKQFMQDSNEKKSSSNGAEGKYDIDGGAVE